MTGVAARWRHWATAIRRGAGRRCPRCGEGELFERWNRVRPRCSACGLRYLLNQGDPWVFLLVLDRAVFIFPPVAILYFGLPGNSLVALAIVFATFIAVLVYTTPHRYGVCVALDWLTRGDDDRGAIGYPSASPVETTSQRDHQEQERG